MKTAALILTVTVLGGCTSLTLDPDHGRSTALNREAQVIHPEAGQKTGEHTLDGVKAEQSVENYHTEKADADDERLIEDVSN